MVIAGVFRLGKRPRPVALRNVIPSRNWNCALSTTYAQVINLRLPILIGNSGHIPKGLYLTQYMSTNDITVVCVHLHPTAAIVCLVTAFFTGTVSKIVSVPSFRTVCVTLHIGPVCNVASLGDGAEQVTPASFVTDSTSSFVFMILIMDRVEALGRCCGPSKLPHPPIRSCPGPAPPDTVLRNTQLGEDLTHLRMIPYMYGHTYQYCARGSHPDTGRQSGEDELLPGRRSHCETVDSGRMNTYPMNGPTPNKSYTTKYCPARHHLYCYRVPWNLW
jgi:hypothetical protein